MVDHLRTDHRQVAVDTADIGRAFADVVWYAERPMMRTAPAPLLELAHLVRRNGIKVVLTGEGADEIFGGYNLFREDKARRFWARQPQSPWRPNLLSSLYGYIKRDAKAEFLAARIPGARFFDIDAISDRTSSLPHMLPPPAQFASAVKKLGVGDGKKVICYDSAGLFSAARCWWMFKAMGHDDVAVLDGGLAKWQREGRPLEDGPPVPPQERHFTPRVRASAVMRRPAITRVSLLASATVRPA